MRDKHIHITQDSELLKTIYNQIEESINFNPIYFRYKLWLKFIVYFSILFLSYYTLYIIKNPIYFIVCFIIYGFASLFIAFNFSHDLSHNTIFDNKKLNNFCFTLTFTIVGAHAEAWKHRHINAHHYAPNVENYDSDLKLTKLIRVTSSSTYYNYHKFQHLYAPFLYTSYSLFWIFIKDFAILFTKNDNTKKYFNYYLIFWLQKTLYITFIIVLPLIYSKQSWQTVMIGFLLMHLIQSLVLLFTFLMTHHVEKTEYPITDNNGYINTSWLMNQIKSSNDMHPFSQTANFLFGGFNNHIAHHLFPHVHHIYYPKINLILYKILNANGITPNYTSYLGGIKSHLKLLKRMSSNNLDITN